MARWAIGLVGLAIGGGCATAETSDQTASSPFSGGFSSVGDGGGADATADDDGGGDATDTEGDEAGTEGPPGDDPTVGPVDTGDEGGEAAGECCTAHGGQGCADAMIEACVCGEDPTCCDTAWDADCVDAVAAFGCGDCGGPPPDGDEGGGMPPAGDCCEAQGGPGCADVAVANCVCNEDPFCCQNAWNEACVAEVDELGCGNCGGAMPADDGGGGGSPCCMPTGGPGCGDPFIEGCICGDFEDPFCCLVEWDDVCAAEVADFGCGPC